MLAHELTDCGAQVQRARSQTRRGTSSQGTREQDRAPGHGDPFLEMSLAARGRTAPAGGVHRRRASISKVQEEVKTITRMSANRMCKLVGVSRATYYRQRQVRSTSARPSRKTCAVPDAIQKQATQPPSYGSRRIHVELKNMGQPTSRKRVQGLTREERTAPNDCTLCRRCARSTSLHSKNRWQRAARS